MVYDPRRPKGPSVVEGKYLVAFNQGVDIDTMVAALQNFIDQSGRSADVKIDNVLDMIGVALVSCDAAFAEEIKKQPYVRGVEQERLHYPMKRGGPKGSGPSIKF